MILECHYTSASLLFVLLSRTKCSNKQPHTYFASKILSIKSQPGSRWPGCDPSKQGRRSSSAVAHLVLIEETRVFSFTRRQVSVWRSNQHRDAEDL